MRYLDQATQCYVQIDAEGHRTIIPIEQDPEYLRQMGERAKHPDRDPAITRLIEELRAPKGDS